MSVYATGFLPTTSGGITGKKGVLYLLIVGTCFLSIYLSSWNTGLDACV